MNRIDEISARSKEDILAKLENAYKQEDFSHQSSTDPIEHIAISNLSPLEEMKQKMSENNYIVEEANAEK